MLMAPVAKARQDGQAYNLPPTISSGVKSFVLSAYGLTLVGPQSLRTMTGRRRTLSDSMQVCPEKSKFQWLENSEMQKQLTITALLHRSRF